MSVRGARPVAGVWVRGLTCAALLLAAGLATSGRASGQIGGVSVANQPVSATPAVGGAQVGEGDAITRATRLIDRLAAEGVETAVLVGLATPGERARAAAAGREALEKLSQAEVELSGRAVALQTIDPQRAKRLREFDLRLRVPLYRARAVLLLGVAEGDLARLGGVIDQLEALDPIAVGPAALRRVNLALALYHRALLMGVAPGQESAELDRAVRLIAQMSEWELGPDASRQVPPLVSAEAWFAAVRLLTHRQGSLVWAQAKAVEAESRPPFVGGAQAAEPGLAIRHAQVRAAAMASVWATAGRAAGFAAVVAPIETTVVPARVGLSVEQCRAVREELTGRAALAVLSAGGREQELPTVALVNASGVLAREAGSQARAVELAELALSRSDVGEARPDALTHAALALSAGPGAEGKLRAVEKLCDALDGGLREPRRGAILAALPQLAGEAARAIDAEASQSAATRLKAGEVRLRALKLSGRAAQGGLSIAQALLKTSPSPDAPQLATALGALAAVTPGTPEAQIAGELAASAIEAALVRARRDLVRLPTATSAGQLARVAQLGSDWHGLRAGERAQAARCRVALAEALVASGDARAIEVYRELLSIEPPPESPMLMTIGLARAQRASGDVVGAFQTYRGLTDMLEEEPTKRPEYFMAWADMLGVLAADNQTRHRDGQIRLRIEHLRSLDHELGAPETKEAVEIVEQLIKR